MKQRPYIFVYDGKFLEHESLMEVRAFTEDHDWSELIAQTIDSYAQLKAISQSGITRLDANDIRIMRSLKRTIDFIKSFDAININKFNIESLISKYHQTAVSEEAKAKLQIKIGSETDTGNSDITVSRID